MYELSIPLLVNNNPCLKLISFILKIHYIHSPINSLDVLGRYSYKIGLSQCPDNFIIALPTKKTTPHARALPFRAQALFL